MTTTITNSTTNDVVSHYAVLERLPRLTAEEETQLLHDLRLASQAPAAKQRLIESYLPRVLTLARQYDHQYRVITFDDLVQEGSPALMGAIDKCATMPITKSLSAYVGTVVRSAFARAIATLRQASRAEQAAASTPSTPSSVPRKPRPVTSETLSATAHAAPTGASVFVKEHCPQSAERARLRSIPPQQRLEEAYAQMVARGETLSIIGLKAAAHTDAPAARAFLRSRGVPRQLGGPLRKASPVASQQTTRQADPLPAERSNSHATC